MWAHWRYSCPTFLSQTLASEQAFLFVIHFGQKHITNNKKPKASRIIALSVRLLLNGLE